MSGGTVGPVDEAQLDALVERYEWFTPARILRVLQTGRSDRRVSIAAVSRLLPLGRFTVDREALCALSPADLIDRFLKEGGHRIVAEEGLGLDVVSGGELYTALKAGFDPEKIHFHGNNKTQDELNMALDNGVGVIVMDNLDEMKRLDQLAAEKGVTAQVSMRIKPGIDAHTHSFIRTGQIDSKFGFALETGEALEAAKAAIASKNLNLKEIHCHIGSQIFDIDPFVLAAEVMMGFRKQIKDVTGVTVECMNLGGGFGIKYTDRDHPQPYNAYMSTVAKAVKAKAKEYDMPVPFICLEPGRSIVGESGITLYTVGSVKVIPKIRTYVSIDGGMTDNPRYALYKSSYLAVIADKAGQPAVEKVTIAGKCCESGDLIQEDAMIQEAAPGDTLAVFSTGAYNYSMSSNYNRIPKPPIVMVKAGSSRVIVKRETYDDLIKNDV